MGVEWSLLWPTERNGVQSNIGGQIMPRTLQKWAQSQLNQRKPSVHQTHSHYLSIHKSILSKDLGKPRKVNKVVF